MSIAALKELADQKAFPGENLSSMGEMIKTQEMELQHLAEQVQVGV